jgi:hypothetical protein
MDTMSVFPGHVGVLPEDQQDVLGVDEERPAGKAAEEQDEHALLQDDAHMLQVLAPIRLGCTESNKPVSA